MKIIHVARQPYHLALLLLLLIYLLLGGFNSTAIPLSKGPDEYVHFTYIRFLREQGHPPTTPAERTQAGYKSDQPPLYHGLIALLTAPLEAREPPHFKFSWEPASRRLIDLILPRALLVRTAEETWPYGGWFRIWFAGRALSLLLSAATITLTYALARYLIPARPWLALTAAGLLAFMPRFGFISALLSDDTLLGLLMALLLLVMAHALNQPRPRYWHFVSIGSLIGLALLTKYSTLLLPLELALFLLWLIYRGQLRWPAARRGLFLSILPIVLLIGPWFGFISYHFNQIAEHGPVLGLIIPFIAGDASDDTAALLSTLLTTAAPTAETASPPPEGTLLTWAVTLFQRFWDVPVFGAPRLYPLPPLTLLMALLLSGAAVGVWRLQRTKPATRPWLMLLTLHLLIFVPLPLLRYLLTGQIHDTAQARHILFPAAPALAILLTAGLTKLPRPSSERIVCGTLVSVMALLGLLHAYHYATAFPPPLPVRTAPNLAPAPQTPHPAQFADGLTLRGYDHTLTAEALTLTLHWRAEAVPTVDYRTALSLHAIDAPTQPRRVWQSHPAHGRLPTRAWEVGDLVADTINMPLLGLPPERYTLSLSLLDWADMPLPVNGGESLTLFSFDYVGTPPPAQPQLWQLQASYRHYATIPLLIPPPTQLVQLSDPAGHRHAPQTTAGALHTFIVADDWPSGVYQLVIADQPTPLSLHVQNFERRYHPPETMMHPVQANFAAEIMLLGYDLPHRRFEPGGGVPLVLYWQSLRRTPHSYLIFNRLLDEQQQVWGGYDRLPKETYPTHLWSPGEVVPDGFAVPIDPAAPPGVYHITLGLYDQADPTAASLPLVPQDSQKDPINNEATSSIRLGPIKIGGPPPDMLLTAAQVTPQHPLTLTLGEPPLLRLHGYDLSRHPDSLRLTLYWESLGRTPHDWTIFAHVRDATGQTITQRDQPAGGGRYPTSLWDAGELLTDTLTIPLPATGLPPASQLIIGLYEWQTGLRLTVPQTPHNEIILERDLS